jgi:translation elongation factor EF-Tu-like GTPase
MNANNRGMRSPHFRAQVRARTRDEGGRNVPLFIIGYRPDLAFENEEYWWGSEIIPSAADVEPEPKIELGETREVDLWLQTPAEILPRLHVGSVFKMMEGHTPVGDGVITLIYEAEAP